MNDLLDMSSINIQWSLTLLGHMCFLYNQVQAGPPSHILLRAKMKSSQQILQRCKVCLAVLLEDSQDTDQDWLQLLQPAMDQFLGEQSKLQLALTHVVSALNSSMAAVENILHVLDRAPGSFYES